jgi:ribosome-binding protein aMBF1 (putative translation factor)
MDHMPIEEPNHYWCDRCGRVTATRAAIDRTRIPVCPPCAVWNDDDTDARLRGMVG